MAGPDLSGDVLEGRYQIVERLSEGAMGVVYRGVRTKLDRPVAIKVMHAVLPGAMKGRKRFEREAQLMARLDHPHCVSIIDFGLHGGKPYVVMELVRGLSLYEMLVEQGRFEFPRAVDVMRQVLSGLAHAHEQGIIHRDIKPANIMITPKAPLGVHARILDFGLARMLGGSTSLSNGVAVGTPSYMAPEQCRGEQLDARVDIYACGIVLFEMLTGKKPFNAADPIMILKKQTDEQPPLLADVMPGDYGALEGVVARALAKSPDARFPSAVAMAEALEAALSGRTAPESTAVMRQLGSSDLLPIEPSMEIPITVGSSVSNKKRPVLRPTAPKSRAGSFVLVTLLAIVVLAGGAFYARREMGSHAAASVDARPHDAAQIDAPVSIDAAIDPVAELAASARQLAAGGKVDAAIAMLLEARRRYPDRAVLPLTAGKLFFSKFWWNDGIANLREAIKLDPNLRSDPDLIATVVRGFTTTPAYDYRLGGFLVELGSAAAPILDEVARTHANPEIRARAAAESKRLSGR
ncbi:MAG: serine/threonine protein kinase [Myxococcales bacterium]|nr:serine/threonine protein kinase [Myxococcales bacterium]